MILSFGRGQPVPVIDKNIEHQGNASANNITDSGNNKNKAPGMDFGWIVGPKYLVPNKTKGDIGFVHAPVQYSLSAVISVPNWWTSLNLNINSCWVEQSGISQMARGNDVSGGNMGYPYLDNICHSRTVESSYHNDINYIVRLPGSPAELPRKFGYDIERVPAIREHRYQEPLADFYIGQEDASLIIKGDELWRSTVVTMGNQKADTIEVLPNMKGIVAKFKKVEIPNKKLSPQLGGRAQDKPCVVRSNVIVWTSEGKTKPLFVRIHPDPKNQQYPVGFGKCADETSRQPGANSQSKKMTGNQGQSGDNKQPGKTTGPKENPADKSKKSNGSA